MRILFFSFVLFFWTATGQTQEPSRTIAVQANLPFSPISVEFLIFRKDGKGLLVRQGVFLEGTKQDDWFAATSVDEGELSRINGYVAIFSNGRTLMESSPYVPIGSELALQLASKDPESVRAEAALLQEQLKSDTQAMRRVETEVHMLEKDVDLLSSAEEREKLELREKSEQERLLVLKRQKELLEESVSTLKKDGNPRRFASRRSYLLDELREISTRR